MNKELENFCNKINKAFNELHKVIEDFCGKIYQDGYEDGKKDEAIMIQDDYYQKGLDDAWDAARKICDIQNTQKVKNIFGADANYVLWNVSASEAIEKMKEWEDKQKAEDEIKVGDEVINNFDVKAVVLKNDEGRLRLITDGASFQSGIDIEWRKTGRHFPQIAEVLDQMKND